MNLQSIDRFFKELNKIDIQDLQKINYALLSKDLLKRKDTLAQAVVIGLSVLTILYIFVSTGAQRKTRVANLTALKEKVAAVETLNKVHDEFSKHLETLPDEITSDQLITVLNDVAIASNVQISTFSPASQAKADFHTLINMRLDILGPTYEDIWRFVNNLEHSPYPMRVNNWTGTPEIPYTREMGDKEPNFRAVIEVSLVNIDKEK